MRLKRSCPNFCAQTFALCQILDRPVCQSSRAKRWQWIEYSAIEFASRNARHKALQCVHLVQSQNCTENDVPEVHFSLGDTVTKKNGQHVTQTRQLNDVLNAWWSISYK